MDSQAVVGELIELLHHGIPDNLPDASAKVTTAKVGRSVVSSGNPYKSKLESSH